MRSTKTFCSLNSPIAVLRGKSVKRVRELRANHMHSSNMIHHGRVHRQVQCNHIFSTSPPPFDEDTPVPANSPPLLPHTHIPLLLASLFSPVPPTPTPLPSQPLSQELRPCQITTQTPTRAVPIILRPETYIISTAMCHAEVVPDACF